MCNTFHTQSAQGTIVAPVFRPLVQYHVDKWELSGSTLTRIHKRARATFFSPEGTKDRPVDLKDLADERVTYFEYADGRKETFTDNWRKAENPKGPSPERFVGKTVFKLSSKPTGRKLVGKQTTLPEPTPLRQPQPVPQQQLQQAEPEAPTTFQATNQRPQGAKHRGHFSSAPSADFFRNAGRLSEGFARATCRERPVYRTTVHARLVA